MKKKVDNKKILIIGIAIITLILMIIVGILSNRKTPEEKQAAMLAELQEEAEDDRIKALSEKTEMQRMTEYLVEFIKKVEEQEYEDAYEILYSEFKENYFPTEKSFRQYCSNYFPEMFNIEVENIERFNNIYILEVKVSDGLNGSKNAEKVQAYFVIRENEYNDYNLSFSVDKCMDIM